MSLNKTQRVLTWICVGVALLVALGGSVLFILHASSVKQVAKLDEPPKYYSLKDVPASTASLVSYKDSVYSFSINYPKDWSVRIQRQNDFDQSTIETIVFRYQVNTGDNSPVEITCRENPKHLTAKQWFEQNGDPNSVAVNPQPNTAIQGLYPFVSKGHIDVDFTDYTFAKQNLVCVVSLLKSNSANALITTKMLQSFQLQ